MQPVDKNPSCLCETYLSLFQNLVMRILKEQVVPSTRWCAPHAISSYLFGATGDNSLALSMNTIPGGNCLLPPLARGFSVDSFGVAVCTTGVRLGQKQGYYVVRGVFLAIDWVAKQSRWVVHSVIFHGKTRGGQTTTFIRE